jgi:hypothetical protein
LHFAAAAAAVVKDGDQTSSRKKVYTRTLLVDGLRLFIKNYHWLKKLMTGKSST